MRATREAFVLAEFLASERAAVEAALERVLDRELAGVPAAAADPVRYAIHGGGKRLRPILFVAAYAAVTRGADGPGTDGDGPSRPPAVYDAASALELIHSYSLVHDDLPCMDDDELRRGRPTTHRVFGAEDAATAGAALIALACRVLAGAALEIGLPAPARGRLVRELCAAAGAGGMVGGQVLDLEAEARHVPLAELEEVHRRKTGALLAASLRLGGLAASASAGAIGALSEYGHALGLAFQIADDVLDVTGSAGVLGKTAGRDAALSKSTFAGLLGIEGARARAAGEIESALGALRAASLDTPELVALGRYVVERDR